MSDTTTNYGLLKPAAGETTYVTGFGESMDTIDTELKAHDDELTADAALIGLRWTDVPLAFSYDGTLSVGVGTKFFPVAVACSIVAFKAYVTTAPTGATIILDLNKNGTTVFSTRPAIGTSQNQNWTGSGSVAGTFSGTPTLAVNDRLSLDIDQVGSTVAGANLTVSVWLRKT